MDVEMLVLRTIPLLPVFPSNLILIMSADQKFLVLLRLINRMPVNRWAKGLLCSVEYMVDEKYNRPREIHVHINSFSIP
jgi:hypothetical protein